MQNAELAFPVGEGGPLAVDEVVLGMQNAELGSLRVAKRREGIE